MKIIEKENIYLELEETNKDSIIKFLAKKMFDAGRLDDAEEYAAAVFERENQVSTSVGNGVAIPHGKSKSVKVPTVYFARTQEQIKWGEDEEDLVDLIFIIAVPDDDTVNDHLRILALLSRKLVDENFRDTLRGIQSVEDAYKLFEEIL